MVHRRVEFKIVAQRAQIVWQLLKGSIITPIVLMWLADAIHNYYGQLAPDWTTETDCCKARVPWAPPPFNFIKHMPTSEYGYVHIRWHQNRVFRNTIEMISISIVVGILIIHGTTGGWTVWAVSGDQWIQH